MGGVRRLAAVAGGTLLVLSGCTAGERTPEGASQERRTPSSPSASAGGGPASSSAPTTTTSTPEESAGPESDGTPQRAALSIPALGIDALPVVPYRGFTDDAPGTEIQDRGVAASPHGPRGGIGPGGIGNYQVTAHRLSSTQAFLDLPEVGNGDRVFVAAGGVEYVYRIVDTRKTSFRSSASLREQRAAVPGRPGVEPSRAMITLSTCATIEDRAAGNYWSDEFGNPEHRIDKIGVLVRSRPADTG